LKQYPRAWNQKLNAFLKSIKFVRSDADFSVYVAQVGNVIIFIIIYIDGLILVCNNKDKLLQVKEELFQKFEMKDLGDLHFFLGMEVERDRAHWIVVKCIFRYLQGTLQFKLPFGGLAPQGLVRYYDADWAGDLEGLYS
jgi:histone deacetylase 1/2